MNPIILTEAINRLTADYAFKKVKKLATTGEMPCLWSKELFASGSSMGVKVWPIK